MKLLVEIEISEGNPEETGETRAIESITVNGKPAKYNPAQFDGSWYTLYLEEYVDGCKWEIQLMEQCY